jgi:hypothetical protein
MALKRFKKLEEKTSSLESFFGWYSHY